MTTTQTDLYQLLRIINDSLGLVRDLRPERDESFDLDFGNGGVRLVRNSGSVDVSPRLTKRELEQWMRAFHAGIILGKQDPDTGRALTRMVDPLATIRTAARGLSEGGDVAFGIANIRKAASTLNDQLVELRDRYPHSTGAR